MAKRIDMPEDDESVWRIIVPIAPLKREPEHRVKIFPPVDDHTHREIERRLGEGEDITDILTDDDLGISF